MAFEGHENSRPVQAIYLARAPWIHDRVPFGQNTCPRRALLHRYHVDSSCKSNGWARLLAYVTGLVNQRLLLQCEYLIAENRILRSHVSGRLRLSDAERCTLAEIGKQL